MCVLCFFVANYPYFKPLVERTAESGFNVKEISADKGYLGAENLLASVRQGAIPYISFKTNSVPDSRGSYGPKSELWTRMYHFYSLHRAEFLQHYHKRSNVETTFHMIKAKFGQRLHSRTLTAQINEALCKVLCHNLCVVIQSVDELAIEAEFLLGLTLPSFLLSIANHSAVKDGPSIHTSCLGAEQAKSCRLA